MTQITDLVDSMTYLTSTLLATEDGTNPRCGEPGRSVSDEGFPRGPGGGREGFEGNTKRVQGPRTELDVECESVSVCHGLLVSKPPPEVGNLVYYMHIWQHIVSSWRGARKSHRFPIAERRCGQFPVSALGIFILSLFLSPPPFPARSRTLGFGRCVGYAALGFS